MQNPSDTMCTTSNGRPLCVQHLTTALVVGLGGCPSCPDLGAIKENASPSPLKGQNVVKKGRNKADNKDLGVVIAKEERKK
ncbi:hypothetical protein V6N12_016132 [Hibiscus sabdariffa]|uniref:Uncharacterized protein n=1 Tax=Hibiscus sabdariffa TaxID=183260 RepID=A0ABR2C8T1_9ROSI